MVELTGKGNVWAARNSIYFDLGDGYIYFSILSYILRSVSFAIYTLCFKKYY